MVDNVAEPEKIHFIVPDDFDFPDALIHPVPRPLPGRILHERHLKQLLFQIVFGIIAVSCFVLSQVGWIQYMSLYFLPLAWLDWIGGALLLIQIVALLRRNALPLHLKVFRDGTAVPAVINELVKKPEVIINGVPSQYAYFANISLRLPGEPEPNSFIIKSIQLPDPNQYDCTYRVGDWVSALCMPVKGSYYINLYGLIGVDENIGVIKRRREKEFSIKDILKLLLLLPLLPGFFLIIFWNVYAIGRFSPLDVEFSDVWPALAIGACSGLVFTFIWICHSLRKARQVKIANEEAVKNSQPEEVYHDFWVGKGGSSWFIRIIVFIGLPFLCAVIVYCWAITLNAVLDKSEARVEVVDIDRTYMQTHAMIFRQYIIEYHFPGKSKKYKFLTSYPHLTYFIDRKAGIIAVHKGAFGWPWVKKIAPL